MASGKVRVEILLVLSCVISLALIGDVAEARRKPPQGPSHFTFYIHNQVYNPVVNNSVFSSVYSAPPLNLSQPNPFNFGVRSTFEAPITKGPSPNSTQIGVAQGVWVLDSKHYYALLHIFTATITTGKYKGTIAILGQEYEPLAVRYLPVVGGTGDFLAARGVATSKLVYIDHVPPAHWTLSFDLDLYYWWNNSLNISFVHILRRRHHSNDFRLNCIVLV